MQASDLSSFDRSLIARERKLEGLGLLLEPAAFGEALRGLWPEHVLGEPELTYLRYKPETSCLAAYALAVDGQPTFIHASAYREGDEAKFSKVLTKFRGESSLEPHLLPENIVVRAFPTDRKLGALKHFSDPAKRSALLRRVLPEHPDLWEAELHLLRYKPERRLVARLVAANGEAALLKLYHKGDFAQAQAGAEAVAASGVHTAPLLGVDARHHLMVWRWLASRPCDTLLGSRPQLAYEIGRVLARFHRQPAGGLARGHDGYKPLRAAAHHVAHLLPEAAERALGLAAQLEARLRAAPPLDSPVHGDFSADQVLETASGVALIDFDAATLGDPACDLGTFVAQLERAIIRGDLPAETLAAIREHLGAGYQADGRSLPERTALYTAAGLLRLAPHAFRTRRANWAMETRQLLERAEILLALEPEANAPCVSSGHADLEADSKLHFAGPALELDTATSYLTPVFGPIRGLSAELLRHKVGRRALIGYDFERASGPTRVLGKVRAKGTDRKTHARQRFLWHNGFGEASPDGVSVAEPLGTLEPLQMTLQRRMPGTNLETLLRSPDAERLMRRVAEAAYKLHQTVVPDVRRHTVEDELAILRRQLGALELPALQPRLERLLVACERLAAQLPESREVTLHRDFYPEQLLVSGERLYLLDLDLCARGDPALDIGNFAAHLREYALRVCGDMGALAGLEHAFIAHYCARSGTPVAAVRIYRTLALARHVAISQRLSARRQLTPALLQAVEGMLESPVAARSSW